MSTFNKRGELDLKDGLIICAIGKKRTGKSILAKALFKSYPGDKIVLDIAGDDGPSGGDIVDLHGTAADLPTRWPELSRPESPDGRRLPMTLRYVPDPGSPTFQDDMDCVVGLALSHGRSEAHAGRVGCAILVHEVGVLAPQHRTPPHTRRLLMHNRHNHTTAIFCGPRPQVIDPLVIQQADLVYTFDLPNPDDRKRLAATMGWSVADFTNAIKDLKSHEYLRYDANQEGPDDPNRPDLRLVHFPPLPPEVVKAANE